MKLSSILAASVITLAAVGCGSAKPEPRTAAADDASRELAEPSKVQDQGTTGMLSISEDIKAACGISDDQAYFAFDSANVRDKDKQVLDRLATCFTSGKMKGRQMQLVGHADPRGDDNYNMALGGKRADNVKAVIVNRGMPDSQVQTTSRGEMDARGHDEMGWAKDRRVDVRASS